MKRKTVLVPTYTQLDLMLASPTEPMPLDKRTHQLTRMWGGLAAIERAAAPSTDDWRVCSDAVNLMESLVAAGWVDDAQGLLADAVQALAHAGRRHLAGHAIRLDAAGIQAVRAVLEDYAAALGQIDHRTMLYAHRATEARIREIQRGRKRPHDVEVMAL
jgi:uncharacterized protein YyaL (SSP411 family)